jgi:hypothetical protein
VTGTLAGAGQNRARQGSATAEMWTWDFRVPDLVSPDDGSVMVSFCVTELDHVPHRRRVRIRVE